MPRVLWDVGVAHWLITGAGRGIGAAIASRACERGDRVTLVARSEQVDDHAAALRDARHTAAAVRADITDPDGRTAAFGAAADANGPVDVLVNNAAKHAGGRIETLTLEDYREVVEADLIAPFDMCKRFAAQAPEAGGAIVNIGAVVGFRGFPGDSPYGSAKAGLAGLTLVLAVELARQGIRVNMVVPGFTETEMTGDVEGRAREKIMKRIPMRRPAEPEEIAEGAIFAATATYVTGSIIHCDGGLAANL